MVRRRIRILSTILVAGTLLASGLLLTCNGEQDGNPTERNPVILVVDGMEIRRSEVAEFEPYLEDLDPTTGRTKRAKWVLEQFVLPLRLAQRAFPAERREQRKRAEALARVLGPSAGYDDLASQSQRVPGAGLGTRMRQALELPEQRWAFADAHMEQVSPILETPRAFTILATLGKRPGPTKVFDSADIWLVQFPTHDKKAFDAWLSEVKKSIADKLTFVHEDYRQAVPYWFKQ